MIVIIVRNMDGEHDVEEKDEAAVDLSYGDEVMCANLTPQMVEFARVAQAFERQQVENRGAMPVDLAFAEIEAFLSRVYAAQE